MGKRSLPVFEGLRSTGKLRLPMAPIQNHDPQFKDSI